jgi:hypothetical protein
MTRRGGAGKGSGSKGCRGAEHGQACTKERTGAVAVRAALESAVQLGRGDEGNRQSEMANPTKCRDSLQIWRGLGACYYYACVLHAYSMHMCMFACVLCMFVCSIG